MKKGGPGCLGFGWGLKYYSCVGDGSVDFDHPFFIGGIKLDANVWIMKDRIFAVDQKDKKS